jgi:hypothetical protein
METDMTNRRSRHLLLPLLALSMSLALAATVHAQQYQYGSGSSVSGTLRINLGGTPRWTSVSGTRVEEIADGQRPDYDMFRYNGSYYAYNNDRWYTSRNDRGDFVMIDDANVPSEFSSIPRDHWRNYPSRWANNYASPQTPSRTSASLQIRFGSSPRWSTISGTRVEEISGGQRPDYDMFRVNNNYYAYNNDRWYSSRNDQGDFVMIDDASVPSELNTVPRDHWRNYPSRWTQSDYGQSQGYSSSMQLNFGYNSRWQPIRGTRVEEMRGRGRSDYDVFRYAGVYYVYSNNQWYTSRRPRGMFIVVDGRNVPWELSRIPRDRWNNYPTAWMDQQRDPRYGYRRGGGRYR